jgi:hypothetical protein
MLPDMERPRSGDTRNLRVPYRLDSGLLPDRRKDLMGRITGRTIGHSLVEHAGTTGQPIRDVFGRFIFDYYPEAFDVQPLLRDKYTRIESPLVMSYDLVYYMAETIMRGSPPATVMFLYEALHMDKDSAKVLLPRLLGNIPRLEKYAAMEVVESITGLLPGELSNPYKV